MGNRVKRYGEVIELDTRKKISHRYHMVTRAINEEFWNSCSDIDHSMYVGSYGRGTAVKTSDVDILVELPDDLFDRFKNLSGNGQSRLLQSVKDAILNVYPTSDIRADGQVVKIDFSDGMKFEILPAFKDVIGQYIYPDSNMGGKWRSSNPKAEQDAVKYKNKISNGLYNDTCKHIRAIRDDKFSSYHLSGIVIDAFVYDAIGTWRWADEHSSSPAGTYEQNLLDYFNCNAIRYGATIYAPGSGEAISTKTSYECLGKVLKNMAE